MKNLKLFNNIYVKSLLLNLIYMVIAFICFEPFATYDDYNMAIQYASGVGAEYAYGQTFITPVFGKIVTELNNLMPFLPWYMILNTLIIFVSLYMITLQIFELKWGMAGTVLTHIILIFYSYEEYAGLNFTKVAGVAAAGGLFIIIFKSTSIKRKFIGYILISVSVMLRYNVFIMVFAVLCVVVLVDCFIKLVIYKQIDKKALLYILVSIFLCIPIYYGVLNENVLFDEMQYNEFEKQVEENSARSGLQDYAVPDYDMHSEEYNEIDFTKNDLDVLYQWNFDRNKLSPSIYEKIEALDSSKQESLLSRVFSLENIQGFFKQYPYDFFQMDVWYALLMIMLFCVLSLSDKKKYIVWMNAMIVIFLNFLFMYYLYIGGRYNQHRVDIGLELALILGFIYLCRNCFTKERLNLYQSGIVFVLFLLVPYKVHDDYSFGVIDQKMTEEIEVFYDEITSDKEHFYLLGHNRGDVDIFRMYSLWDITKNNYENKYTNTSLISNFFEDDYLQEYGISDIYLEAVDSQLIRFVLNENDTDVKKWEKYFSDKCGKEVELKLIENNHAKNIYKVRTK